MLDEYIAREFTKKFESINENFKNIVEMLFPNCTGWLELNEDEGVDIAFLSSRKMIKKLSLLSGGERALLSIAFMFSIYNTMPSPFYIFDEVDAALDDVNLSRFIRLLSDFSRDKQVILITHQKQTMEASNVIYGVSMQPNGTTKIISERVKEIALS
jgi:chromosome segregation protein